MKQQEGTGEKKGNNKALHERKRVGIINSSIWPSSPLTREETRPVVCSHVMMHLSPHVTPCMILQVCAPSPIKNEVAGSLTEKKKEPKGLPGEDTGVLSADPHSQ